MVTAIYHPVESEQTVIVGTDHVWAFRRVNSETHEPIIPTSAKAQIRSASSGELWIDCEIRLDSITGWIYVVIAESATADKIWRDRYLGMWDMEVIVGGFKYRWIYGAVIISPEVTLS